MIGAYSKNRISTFSGIVSGPSLSNDIRSPRSRSIIHGALIPSIRLYSEHGVETAKAWVWATNIDNVVQFRLQVHGSRGSPWYGRFLKPRTASTPQRLELMELLITTATHLNWTPSCSLSTVPLMFLKSPRQLSETRSWDRIRVRLVHEVSYPFRSYTHAKNEIDIPYTSLLILRQTKLTTKLDLRNL